MFIVDKQINRQKSQLLDRRQTLNKSYKQSKKLILFNMTEINIKIQIQTMRRQKKAGIVILAQHSRQPSQQNQRNSNSRKTIHHSPPSIHTYYLSNPSSLEKKQVKKTKKKMSKLKETREQPTRETSDSLEQSLWKNNIKKIFDKNNYVSNQKRHVDTNSKLRQKECERNLGRAGQSYINLTSSFSSQQTNVTMLQGRQRVYFIDWLYCVASQLLLRRNTFHLGVAIVDTYLGSKGSAPNKLQAVGAAALLLSVKQEERANEESVLRMLSQMGIGLFREQIIKVQSAVVLGLNFKLNFNILPFWCDYFSQKWDSFVKRQTQKDNKQSGQLIDSLAVLRHPEPTSYKCYRETMQLLDACLMHQNHREYQFPKLSLSVIYLVVRIQTEASYQKAQGKSMYEQYFTAFQRKASPIFKDRLGFNSIFNEFTAEVCDFQITELIPAIRWCAQFLNMGFSYQIQARAYQSAHNYEQFLRFTDYSSHIGDYFLENIFG